jgi:5-methylthioadenosine/S-adenosylhomocysteine deaminase
VKILKDKNVSVAINPRSNMKLGNGFANVQKLLDAGINICLGTDGSGSNNTQNMFQEMQFASLVYKGSEKKAKCVDAVEVLKAATVGGAKALKMEGEIGVIKEGALADIIIIDTDSYHFMSPGSFEANLVYSAHSDCVDSVICNGRLIMKDRVVPGEKEILDKARKMLHKLI